MTTYENNIAALVRINPLLATQIFAITENKKFEVFQGEDPAAVNVLDLKKELFLYDNPINDVLALSNIKKEEEIYFYRYFFGIGNGIYLKMALAQPKIKRIIIVEPEIELLYIVLNLIDFSKEIESKKLVLELAENINFSSVYDLLNNAEAKLFARSFSLEVLSNYYMNDDTQYNKVLKIFADTLSHIIVGHGNSPIDSLEGIENHYKNLPDMLSSAKFSCLLGTAKKQTAVIVSTGPSLTKQLPLLKKIKDHALIICVDASFPILEKHGIKPDYVTVLERVPETAKFFENNALEFQKDVNFVCVSIIHEDVKNAIREGNLILQMRPHGYTQYFGLSDYGYIGGGMSAANLAHELAVVLAVDNIIFIGQDLAFGEDNTSHAQDHTFTVNEEKAEGHDLFVPKYGGKGQIRTTFYWNLFRDGIEHIAENTKHIITTINATEGGARINGTTEMSFSNAIDTYVDMGFQKTNLNLVYADETEINNYKKIIVSKTNHMLSEAVDKQEQIEELFIKVQEISEDLVRMSEQGKLDEIDYDKIKRISNELDVVKSFTEDSQFNDMFMDMLQSQLLQIELELAPLLIKRIGSEEARNIHLVDWIMKHRFWLFSIAGGIDAQRQTIISSIKKWPEELKSKIIIPEKKVIKYDQEKYEKLLLKSQTEQEQREKQAQENLDAIAKSLNVAMGNG